MSPLSRSFAAELQRRVTPLAHLEAADALAREHLGEAGLEGQIRRAVGEALSAAREGP